MAQSKKNKGPLIGCAKKNLTPGGLATPHEATKHINFLKAWLDEERNKGKPFKWAFQALITKFEFN